MFFLSFFFSKSIVSPIKILSRNTNLERDKVLNNRKIITYPNRKDEIGKLSEDIQSMSSDLKKRIKQIEEFVFDVSHELKNPLTGLKSSSDLLKTDKLENKNKELLVNNISTEVDRMNILISDISNYSLTQFEISEEALEEVELVSLLNNFKETIKNKTYSLEIINENKALYLHINKNKFIQVIHNLLDNALAFIPKNSKILIFIKATEKNCIINFVDQGPGINMSYKDKIFERFYTDRLKNKKEHSGLGLSISKKIIEDLGGSIYLIKSSHLGFEGACFEIKLPLKD
jgi:two-component system sensor histidine kinase ChvG